MKDLRNLLLIIYFILIHLFGFLSSHTEVLSELSDSSTIYLFAGFPVFFLIYSFYLYHISVELKRHYVELFHRFGFKNPLRSEVTVVTPLFFFQKELLPEDPTLQRKVKRGKLSLIFSLSSFFIAIVLLITGHN